MIGQGRVFRVSFADGGRTQDDKHNDRTAEGGK
jgi:hypothetical protein